MIQFLKKYKFHLITIVFGATYAYFLIYIHDVTSGDYQLFVKDPVNFMYGIERWNEWSSRLLIENSVNIFSKYLFAWKIITIISGALLFWSISRILGNRRIYQSIVLFGVLLMVNMYILTTAGIFATTINYLWPMACFVFVIAVIAKPFQNKTMSLIARISIWPLAIFAVCSEQLAMLGVLLAGGYIAYGIFTKKPVPVPIYLLLGLSILGVINLLVAPGVSERRTLEAAAYWQGFESISVLHKFAYGFVVTYSRLLIAPELPAILLIYLLVIASYVQKNIRAFVSAAFAAIVTTLFFFPVTWNQPPTHVQIPNYLNEIGHRALYFAPVDLPTSQLTKIFIVVFTVITICVVLSIIYLFGRKIKTLVLLGVLSAGLIVSLAVSLSPTLFASSTRTLYPLIIILVGIDAYIINSLITSRFESTRISPETKQRSK